MPPSWLRSSEAVAFLDSIMASMRSSMVPLVTNLWTSTLRFSLLANAAGAVGGLVFDDGIPQAVEVADVAGGR